MKKESPILTIITINLNNLTGLIKTIESVVSQTYTDFEYIIIDGGSTDGSLEVIKEYADKISWWVSEPDKGIYNAMNKGILRATGEYCLFLNSGDWFMDENITKDFCYSNFNEDFVAGSSYLYRRNKCELRKAISSNDLSYLFFLNSTLIHQSTFIKKEVFEIIGLYNENFKIVSDWEFFIKALILHNCSYLNFDRVISVFNTGGISSDVENEELHDKERQIVLNTLLPRVQNMYLKLNVELINIQKEIDKYHNLEKGIFGFIIKGAFFIKNVKRKLSLGFVKHI